MTKHIFITGGVASSLGKGINASSIGRLLKSRGLKVFMQKMDPYINVDPSNMSPLQHGEVFVTDDGAETDLDLGHYERFIDERLNKTSSVTTGRIYLTVINRERNGEYEGGTVQVVPHITGAIKETIYNAAKLSGADVLITEIGGTVGDIEGLPYLEAIRQMRRELGYHNTFYIHNTLVPYLQSASEIKTKPTQHSIKQLGSLGINADMLILRTERAVSQAQKEKISMFCDVDVENVIEALDVKILYEVPLNFHKQNVDEIICKHFQLETKPIDLTEWTDLISSIKNAKKEVTIGLVGKYTDVKDSYISVNEALKHAGYNLGIKVKIVAIAAENITKENASIELSIYNGLIVPGGFGNKAIEGIINTIEYARVNNIPLLGICLGMQLAIVEYVQNVLNKKEAHSPEFKKETPMPLFFERDKMKVGLFTSKVEENSLFKRIYNAPLVSERYRHLYEFNNEYAYLFKNKSLVFSSYCVLSGFVESIELKDHPFFVGVQFHPEFLSRPNRPHPLFFAFIKSVGGKL